jgi:hypothetical protein
LVSYAGSDFRPNPVSAGTLIGNRSHQTEISGLMHPIAGTVQRRPRCHAHSAFWLTATPRISLYLLSLLSLLSRHPSATDNRDKRTKDRRDNEDEGQAQQRRPAWHCGRLPPFVTQCERVSSVRDDYRADANPLHRTWQRILAIPCQPRYEATHCMSFGRFLHRAPTRHAGQGLDDVDRVPDQ